MMTLWRQPQAGQTHTGVRTNVLTCFGAFNEVYSTQCNSGRRCTSMMMYASSLKLAL